MYTQYQKQKPASVRIAALPRSMDRRQTPPKQRSGRNVLLATLAVIVIFVMAASLRSGVSHAATNIAVIKSGIAGDCLDVQHSGTAAGTPVDDYGCNDTSAQAWQIGLTSIKHAGLCLSVKSAAKAPGAVVELDQCSSSPGQVWIKDVNSLYNPNSQQCLKAPSSAAQLIIASCNNSPSESWISSQNPLDCAAYPSRGEKVACSAIKDWNDWQSPTSNHTALLQAYTDGAPYEEWCADFVSYAYKQAGYPFANGEANGWDESNANYVKNQGFSMHSPSRYVPQTGDVAYFDYNGGHVEIVISGGKTPSFIYGNSAAIDPATGNGEMASNTKTSDGSLGKLVYYLSP
ncbi:MAG TPA: ricin-type beta-trefoil lectin domain protein [Candidatus Saccharimonadales bacterium]|nr:ricin-type beta-trefoil lectin domain protein [Candidatus Saccharimonadales bacterium]